MRRAHLAACYDRNVTGAAPELDDATIADLLAIPESERFHEVIDGELVRKAMPSIRHGMAQMGIGDAISGPYGPRSRGRGPGGWVFASETERVRRSRPSSNNATTKDSRRPYQP